jgi:hypothetical protein
MTLTSATNAFVPAQLPLFRHIDGQTDEEVMKVPFKPRLGVTVSI